MSDGDSTFTDGEALNNLLQDARAADTRTVSNAADAKALIDTFRAASAASPWTSLDRGTVADRLAVLVENPRLLLQGSLNLCGPASFLMCWNARDPVGFIKFATTLFDTGQSAVGSMNFAPGSDLVGQDYNAMQAKMSDGHGGYPQ
jgi:hypothetical protein